MRAHWLQTNGCKAGSDMARLTPAFYAFNAGEWSPDLYGRIDLEKYRQAASSIENFVLSPQGSAIRRPGTRFVAQTKNNSTPILIPFQFSSVQTYQIEAGQGYFRFYKDQGVIQSTPNVPYEIASPYQTADLPGLQWAQSADVLYLFHPNYQPRKLSRTGHTNWTLTAMDQLDGPYLDQNADATKTLTPAASSGNNINVTANFNAFAATDVGRHIRILHSSTWGWAKIVSFTSATVVKVNILRNFAATTASKDWRLGAWSDTTGWPSCGIFYQERLWLGGVRNLPQNIFGSVAADFENHAPSKNGVTTIADDDAISATIITGDQVNPISWLSAGKNLLIGTLGGEFILQASNLNEAVTPSNLTVIPASSIGCAALAPVRIDNAVLYIQRFRRALHEIAYSFEADTYRSPEMTIFARHLAKGGLKRLAFQRQPWSILWAIDDQGVLMGFTYLRDQDVLGWHTHPLGGTNTKVCSIAVIAGTSQDELWLVVERTINGQVFRSVEFMEYEFLPAHANDKAKAFFVDCGLSYNGAPIQTINGLNHLAGETISILADGAAHRDLTVSALGSVTLDRPASIVHAGLYHAAELTILDIEAGAEGGNTSIGKPQRIFKCIVRFLNTLGGKVGLGQKLEEVSFRTGSTPMDQSPALFTGDKNILFPQGWDASARVTIRQEQPLPMTILAIAPSITIEGI